MLKESTNMTEFDTSELVNCDKIFKNKYGLFRIRVEQVPSNRDTYSKRIFLYKWQNSWEFVLETKVSDSFHPSTKFTLIESKLQGMANSRIEEVVNMSEAMFAPYNSISFLNKFQLMRRIFKC
jgi:hypothetical protein